MDFSRSPTGFPSFLEMYLGHLGLCLFWSLSIVHSLLQSHTTDDLNLDLIGTNDNKFSRNIDYMAINTSTDQCLNFNDRDDNFSLGENISPDRKSGKSSMCTGHVVHSLAEHQGEHGVFNVSPLDGRQAPTNARAEKDFKICPEEFFPGRPIPVCPSPLGGALIKLADETFTLQYATSMFLIFHCFDLDL